MAQHVALQRSSTAKATPAAASSLTKGVCFLAMAQSALAQTLLHLAPPATSPSQFVSLLEPQTVFILT